MGEIDRTAKPGTALPELQQVGEDTVASRKQQRQALQNQQPDSLYANRVKVYPKSVQGLARQIKWAILALCLSVYYITPWLRWDRGEGRPDQAILIDMAGRRAYLFDLEIWPQEVYFLTGLLILAAVGLFFVTSLFGRLWCGYTCPQTVWTDLFMWVERLVEGDRNARIKLDQAPFSVGKAARKTVKHGIWLAIAAATGGAWIMYYNDAPTVTREVLTGQASSGVYFFFGLFTATTYVLAGLAREQVCTYMCPWPRFQAAMLDEQTFIVTYQNWRGEPRGKHKAGESWDGRGDCIDCRQCVAVCPTGIDIRDGVQLECINCGLCVDACNSVMDKVERPRGLITWDTLANQAAKAKGQPTHYRLLRPRTIIYLAFLVLLSGVMLLGFLSRETVELTALRDRAPLFVTLSDGSIRNGYTLKIVNKDAADRQMRLTVDGLGAGSVLRLTGPDGAALDPAAIVLRRDDISTLRLTLSVPRAALHRDRLPLTVTLIDINDGVAASVQTVFIGPDH